jgi:hypothetical protein
VPNRLAHPSQIEHYTDEADGAWTYEELKQGFRKSDGHYHEHVGGDGIVHKCWHKCNGTVFNIKWWLAFTAGFYAEHLLMKIPPFLYLTRLLGLDS